MAWPVPFIRGLDVRLHEWAVAGRPNPESFRFVQKNGKVREIVTHLDVLAVTPTTALVRVDMEKDAIGADYNDFLTLIKTNGDWKVIAKVYHQFED